MPCADNQAKLKFARVNVGAPAACDKVAWSLLGISMPGWNVISSTAVAGLWALVARKA